MGEEIREPTKLELDQAKVLEWVGELILLKYQSGPSINPENIREVVKGPIEARTGIFYLRQAGQLGIEVVALDRNEESAEGSGAFVPWSSVLVIVGPPEETKGS
jgi:hypothetical protein